MGRGKKKIVGVGINFWGGVKKNFLGGNNFLGMGKKKIFPKKIFRGGIMFFRGVTKLFFRGEIIFWGGVKKNFF